MERQVKGIGGAAFCALLMVLLALAACQLDLFDAVKREVEDYRGSPEIVVLKGVDEVQESTDVPIGPAIAGDSKQVTFSIENQGKSELRLTGSPRVQIGGTHAGQFAINTLPASVIASGGKSDLIIEFSPIGTGVRTATLVIENDASADGAFDFSIVGEGVGTAGPEIQVTVSSTVIDENQPYVHGFGKLVSGATSDAATFTIYNIGTPTSLLQLLEYPDSVEISGANASMFSVSTQPDKQWLLEGDAAQDHASFQVTYHPTALGTHTATVSILNNDANGDETNYTFGVSGSCYQLDVLFLLGVNGAMGYGLLAAKTGIADTMSTLSALDPNAAFALATFNDFPYGSWGSFPAEAYALLQSLTNDQAGIVALLSPLSVFDGNDIQASQLVALYHGTTGAELEVSYPLSYTIPAHALGWRGDALHVIVLISDSPFHYPLVEFDYPGHTYEETTAAMDAAGVELIAMSVGYNYGQEDMARIAADTGGVFFSNSYYDTGAVVGGIYTLMSQY